MDALPDSIHRYQVLKRLGRGGMGIVYLTHDPVIGREVAVKVLRSLDDAGMLERFKREIRIAGALTHASIVRIYDAGAIDDQPFVAMEYVAGQTLDLLIKRVVPLDLDRKLAMLIDLADGLAYAHHRLVVHRDIKPANLIVDEHGRLKILDFGVARFSGVSNTSNWAIGTPGYMAPEQLNGRPADTRSDIFAAGVVTYEFVAYRKPFAAPELAAVHHRILHETPAPLSDVAPGVPAALDRLVARCLDKVPERRLQEAAQLATALREIRESLTDEETTLTATAPPAEEAPGEAGSGPSTPRRAASTARRVAELRRRALQDAKARARDALARGDHDETIAAAEQALMLDASDADALSLLGHARDALDRVEVRRLLGQSRVHVAAGEIASARLALAEARALGIVGADLEALEAVVQSELDDRTERVARAALAQERVRDALDHAARGSFAEAQRAVDEALLLSANDPEALRVQAHINAALAARRADERRRQAAPEPVRGSLADSTTEPTVPPSPPATRPEAEVPTAVTIDRAPAPLAAPVRGAAPEWGRSLRLAPAPRLHAAGWAISAGVHAGLTSLAAWVLFTGYTLARPEEPPLAFVMSAAPVPHVPQPVIQPRAATPTPTRGRSASEAVPLNDRLVNATPAEPAFVPPDIAPVEAPQSIAAEILASPGLDVPSAPAVAATGSPGSTREDPVTDFDQGPVLVTRIRPKLPVGASGVVRVEVVVRSNGAVSRVRVLDETPYASAISEAASQCLFRPARRRGRPVTVIQIIQFNLTTVQ